MKSDFMKLAFENSIRLSEEGRYEQAVEVLENLLKDRIDRRERLAAVHGQLGHLYLSNLHKFWDAERHFRAATALVPRSEGASLGLFHSLMKQRKVNEALQEMKRFLLHKPSDEYRRILEDIGTALQQDPPEPPRQG